MANDPASFACPPFHRVPQSSILFAQRKSRPAEQRRLSQGQLTIIDVIEAFMIDTPRALKVPLSSETLMMQPLKKYKPFLQPRQRRLPRADPVEVSVA